MTVPRPQRLGMVIAISFGVLGPAAFADEWAPSDPLFTIKIPFELTAQLFPAPACLTMGDSSGIPLKLASVYTPCTDEAHQTWLTAMRRWRSERRIRVGYDDSLYDLPALRWTQSSFIQPQMMAHDRYFFDPAEGRYTVDRYLDDLETRYGGIDAVLIWPVYPNLGIDDRNQLDMIRSMPGGVNGVRQLVAEFHHRGVRVLFPMTLWDEGTRDPGEPWPQAIAKLMAAIGADGVNGDTQDGVPRAFPDAAAKIGHPLAYEPEVGAPDEAIAYNAMNWGYYKFVFVPGVDRFRWFEPRHMVHVSDRMARDKTDDLQFAFFNGEGWESWENVWGIWNGITLRDAEAARRVATIERAAATFLTSVDWEPYFPMLHYGVYASRWPLGGEAVWTIVNRNEYDISGPQMTVEPGFRYFDLYHGTQLQPTTLGGKLTLSFDIEARGYGAIFASKGAPPPAVAHLMDQMKAMTSKPLAGLSNQWTVLPQRIEAMHPTSSDSAVPTDMIKIPEAEFLFEVHGIEIEGAEKIGVDVQYPWEDAPRLFHEHSMHIAAFWIDKYPVSNEQFKRFLDATRYAPTDTLNFLRDWKDGNYPRGWADKPVTWVSREDAEAYAAWAGKRLPHEWEWQYAAQGTDGRLYPWGNAWNPAAVPTPDKGRTMRGPDDVSAHANGASGFGVMDMVGNVWQWTDAFVDEHTRAAVLRGGSYYQPQGSLWYFPQAHKLTQHGKLLLMAPGMDRSGAVGFRCVKDAGAASR